MFDITSDSMSEAASPTRRLGVGVGIACGTTVSARGQHGPPASTRKNDSLSASVAEPRWLWKSGPGQRAQQLPARQAKKASMSASVEASPSPLKSAGHEELWNSYAPRSIAGSGGLDAGPVSGVVG